MALTSDNLLVGSYCLHEVSKDIRGDVTVRDAFTKQCTTPSCQSLTLVLALRLELRSSQCDSALGALLDGPFLAHDLTTMYAGTNEHSRGMHASRYLWRPTVGGTIQGTLNGVTNAGTARPPAFPRCKGCESCSEDGLLTGHLFGTGLKVPGLPARDVNIDAVYRLTWDPSATINSIAPVSGTLEGLIIVPCS